MPYLQIIHWHIITNYLVLVYTIFSLPVFLVEPLGLASFDRLFADLSKSYKRFFIATSFLKKLYMYIEIGIDLERFVGFVIERNRSFESEIVTD